MRLDEYGAIQSLIGLSAHCPNSYFPQLICTVYNALHMRDVYEVFLEDPFLINLFCTITFQSYILLPFLNGFYRPLYIYI